MGGMELNNTKLQIKIIEGSIDFHKEKIEKLKILLKKVKGKCNHKDENGKTNFVNDGYNADYIVCTCRVCGETEII